MLPLVEPELLLRVSMLPSRCSSVRQRRGPGGQCAAWGWGTPWAGLPAWRHPSGSIYIFPHVLPRWDRWQLRSQGGSWRRAQLPWLAGSSCFLIVGTPLGQKYGRPAIPEPTVGTCHTCTHTHAQPACSPNFLSGSCPGSTGWAEGRSQDLGRTAASLPDLSLPLLPCPTCSRASTWA